MVSLFTYGSLMSRDIFEAVSGVSLCSEPASAEHFARYAVLGEEYPAAVVQDDSKIEGILYWDVSETVLNRLDLFEGEEYERITVQVTTVSGSESAEIYCFRESFRYKLSEDAWSFEQFESEKKEQFLELCRSTGFQDSRRSRDAGASLESAPKH